MYVKRESQKIIFIIALLSLTAFSHKADARDYVFSVVPWAAPSEMKAMFQPMMDYIRERTGLNFTIVMLPSYDEVINEISKGNVQFGSLNAVAYLKLLDTGTKVKYIATSIRDFGDYDRDFYYGYIITHKDSGVNVFMDLRDKVFGFVDKTSGSGYKMPIAYMKGLNLNPDTFFKKYFFLGDHDEVIKAVANKQIDAGATWEASYLMNEKKFGHIFKIIQRSPPIPNDVWVLSNNIPDSVVSSLKEALLGINRQTKTSKGILVLDEKKGMNDVGYALRGPEFYTKVKNILLYEN